jgi:hypothetical protein
MDIHDTIQDAMQEIDETSLAYDGYRDKGIGCVSDTES